MSERKLAHVELVEWILPIPGADNIELCGILGWQCIIAKKDYIRVGDKVCYIEIDSVCPPTPVFSFLEKYKYRIKTQKMRGVISQGLVIPLKSLGLDENLKVGTDLTQQLKITKHLSQTDIEDSKITNVSWWKRTIVHKYLMKYPAYRTFFKKAKNEKFPSWIPKTDEERIQNCANILTAFGRTRIYVTEKLDGQSATFANKATKIFSLFNKYSPCINQFVICSRNLVIKNKNNNYYRNAVRYNLEKVLKGKNLIIQGEQCGPGIQSNKYGFEDLKLYVFNIIDHDKGQYYTYQEMLDFCTENGLDIVPIIKYNDMLEDIGKTVSEIVEFSKRQSVVAKIPAEGIVIRSIKHGIKLFSFKCINPEFLLKYE